jgi:cytochrome c oxidase assembly protein subunit 15
MYRRLALFTACLAFVVVAFGAYVRLMDAGLGCPDWPGCYGEITPEHAAIDIAKAVAAQGGTEGPVSLPKAWKEMIHRYLAGTLGLLIATLAVWSWRSRSERYARPLATALVGLVMLQAALGMWTVTLLLKPVIVSLHLLGGMATLALLTWLALKTRYAGERHVLESGDALRPWAALGLVILVCQIALGGWVSTNYDALACIDFPMCHGAWMPPDMDFRHGFQLVRELGRTASGTHLAYGALTAIHWTHRVGALVTFLYLGSLGIALARTRGYGVLGALLLAALCAQVTLGITNILAGLPLPVAVAHNAVAALLLALLVVLNFRLFRKVPA